MKITLTKTRDGITPSLRASLKRAEAPQKALEAMGLVVVSMAKRAFTMPSFRPAPWAPLRPKTIQQKKQAGRSDKPLQRTGTLAKSPRVIRATRTTVTVGSDRKAGGLSLAAIHQLGAPKASIPERPFFPFIKDGKPTQKAKRLMLEAAQRTLQLERK